MCTIIGIVIVILIHNRSYNGNYQKIEYDTCGEYDNIIDLTFPEENETKINNSDIKGFNPIIPEKNEYRIVSNHLDYSKLLDQVKSKVYPSDSLVSQFDDDFFIDNSLLVIDYFESNSPFLKTRLISVSEKNSIAKVKIFVRSSGCTADGSGDMYFIPVSKNIKSAEIVKTSF